MLSGTGHEITADADWMRSRIAAANKRIQMPVEPDTFTVQATDKATGQPMPITVTRGGIIHTQADAEEYVSKMTGSRGGTHPGFDVKAVVAEPHAPAHVTPSVSPVPAVPHPAVALPPLAPQAPFLPVHTEAAPV